MTSIAERIRDLRAEKHLEQTELAEASGISYSAIQKYEGGFSKPRPIYEKKLADFFGVSVEYLRGETDDRGDGFEIHAHRDPESKGMPLTSALDLVDKLEKLSRLHDDGKITDEEYIAFKKKLLK